MGFFSFEDAGGIFPRGLVLTRACRGIQFIHGSIRVRGWLHARGAKQGSKEGLLKKKKGKEQA